MGRSLGLGLVAALLAGCGGAQTSVVPQAVVTPSRVLDPGKKSGAPQYVYVSNTLRFGPNYAGAVDIYPGSLNGDVSPSTVISGSNTQLGEVNGIVVDSAGEIYVVSTDSDKIVGFAPGSTGNSTPNVVISGSYTGLSRPTGLAIDSNGDLYVANCASGCGVGSAPPAVLEFAAGSNGNVSPIRDIAGSYTQLENANDVALDSSGNIYVSNFTFESIDVFDASANGNASPVRVISGSATLLDGPEGIVVDKHGLYAGGAFDAALERFVQNANGNVAPVAVVSGSKTRLGDVDGIALDARGVVYTANPNKKSIREFSALGSGDVRPFGEINGPNTQLVAPEWVYAK
jgi:sugar lactone lactonase YvrE